MKIYVTAAVIAVAMCSTVANAQSLADKEYFASEEKSLAEEVTFMNQKCETNITAKFDWSTPPKPEERRKYSASGYCKEVFWPVWQICEKSQAGKDAVKQKIKSVTCGFAAKRSLALKDGVIDYKIEWDATNNSYYALEYLQNNL